MKIAVTGATGFIGRYVLNALAARGVDFVSVSRGSLPATGGGHRHVAMDVLEAPDNAYKILGRPDVVIHLAWGGLPNYRSLHHFERELPGHYRFLRSLIEAGLDRLVVTGTCLEYGMRSGALHEETDTSPVCAYGAAKDSLRRQLEFLNDMSPFSMVWARMFYMYGEGQPETSLYAQLRAAASRGDPVFNMSEGEQLRDYIHVSEAARHITALALDSAERGTVNLCSGRPVSVRRLVEQWLSENGWRIMLNLGHLPYPEYEPMAFWGDRAKLDRWLKSA